MLLNSLATRRQLAVTPSMTDGLPREAEMELRALGCQIIQQIGVLLRLPQRTMAVAQVFFQRFWFTSSMCDFSANEIALGALLLSTKLEETQVRLRHLLNAYDYVLYRLTLDNRTPAPSSALSSPDQAQVVQSSRLSRLRPSEIGYQPLASDSAELHRLRDAVVVSEMQILKRLEFHVQVVLPYSFLVNYLQALGLTDPDLKVTVKPHREWDSEFSTPPIHVGDASPEPISLAQCAWSFLNDA